MKKILYVEHDKKYRAALTCVFEDEGIAVDRVLYAESLKDILDLLEARRHEIGVILVAARFSGGGAIALIDHFKGKGETLPLIVIATAAEGWCAVHPEYARLVRVFKRGCRMECTCRQSCNKDSRDGFVPLIKSIINPEIMAEPETPLLDKKAGFDDFKP